MNREEIRLNSVLVRSYVSIHVIARVKTFWSKLVRAIAVPNCQVGQIFA